MNDVYLQVQEKSVYNIIVNGTTNKVYKGCEITLIDGVNIVSRFCYIEYGSIMKKGKIIKEMYDALDRVDQKLKRGYQEISTIYAEDSKKYEVIKLAKENGNLDISFASKIKKILKEEMPDFDSTVSTLENYTSKFKLNNLTYRAMIKIGKEIDNISSSANELFDFHNQYCTYSEILLKENAVKDHQVYVNWATW